MPKPKKRRILIVDDHPMIREGLREIFRSTKDLAVCGEAEDSQQTFAAIEKLQPDLALVDISLRNEDGIELTRRLHHRWPALPVVVISLHVSQAYCDRAREAGARGYCAKDDESRKFLDVVRQVLKGQSFVSNIPTR